MSDLTNNRMQSSPNGMSGKGRQGSGDVAEQARTAGRDIKDRASELADTATRTLKDQANGLADTAKELTSEAGEKIRSQVENQKAAGADYIGNIAQAVRRAANEFDGEVPQAAQYIRKAAGQIENVSEAVRQRDLSELVDNVQQFARRQPTAFFGAAVLLGFAAIRFLKSSAPGQASGQGTGATHPHRNYQYGGGTSSGGMSSGGMSSGGMSSGGTSSGMAGSSGNRM